MSEVICVCGHQATAHQCSVPRGETTVPEHACNTDGPCFMSGQPETVFCPCPGFHA